MPVKKLNLNENKYSKNYENKPDKQEKPDSADKKETNVESKLAYEEENNEDTNNKKMVRKAGRTLLVSITNNAYKIESTFTKLTGLSVSHSTENGSFFLTFDTIENALNSFHCLRQDYPEIRVKFARYQIFFTVKGLSDSSDYTAIKQNMTNFIENESGAIVLYFKLYRKGDKYLGCGDFTVDTKDAMDKLLNKEGSLKNYTINDLSGTFYRYNKIQNKHENNEEQDYN